MRCVANVGRILECGLLVKVRIQERNDMRDSDGQWQIKPTSYLERVAGVWDSLNRRTGSVPFLQSIFVQKAIEYFGQGSELLATFGPESAPLAMAIVRQRRIGVWETFQPSQMPLGAWLMHSDMDYAMAGQGLLRALPGWGQLFAITQQDPAIHARPSDGSTLLTIDYIKTGWIALDSDFDGYWRLRGKGLRQNMRTQRTKLARDSIDARLRIVRDAAEVDDVVRVFADLECSGWKGKEGTAVQYGTTQGKFYRDVLREYCKRGLAILCVYLLDEEPVAVDLHISLDDTLVLLKTAYKESVGGLSPSSMMRKELLEVLFAERQIRRLEFFGPAMDWTYRWTDKVRTLFHVNVYRSAAARLAHRLYQL